MFADEFEQLTAEEEEVAHELENFLCDNGLVGLGRIVITDDLVLGLTPRILRIVNERISNSPLDISPEDFC